MKRWLLTALFCVVSALLGAAWTEAQQRKVSVTTDDFVEIQQLLWTNHTGYDFAFRDKGDMWTSTFLPDAVIDNGLTHLVGEREIRETSQTPTTTDPTRKFRHWTSTFHVTPNDEGAILSAFYLTVADDGANKGMLIGSTGRYESQVVKTKRGWRIKHHVIYGEGGLTARPEPPRAAAARPGAN